MWESATSPLLFLSRLLDTLPSGGPLSSQGPKVYLLACQADRRESNGVDGDENWGGRFTIAIPRNHHTWEIPVYKRLLVNAAVLPTTKKEGGGAGMADGMPITWSEHTHLRDQSRPTHVVRADPRGQSSSYGLRFEVARNSCSFVATVRKTSASASASPAPRRCSVSMN